jgi:restriction system protein
VFVLVGYVAPLLAPSNQFAQAVLKGFARHAWVFALPFALLSIGVLVRDVLRGRLLDGQRDLESVRALRWQEFEHLVGEAFRRQGFRVEERGGAAPDGGVDLVLFRDGRKTVVQCKRWRTKQVGVALVRDLYGAMTAETADEAIFVSSGEYTADARRFADGKPIRLVDGSTLLEMVRSVQRTTVEAPPGRRVDHAPLAPTSSEDPPPACPRCGNAMVMRIARTGTRSGSSFWGCTGFPDCRGTRPAV